jgi:mRNA interferase MazF
MPVGFTDRSGIKRRPAVIVSSDGYNAESPDVMIVSITGNLQALRHPGDHVIRHWRAAGRDRPWPKPRSPPSKPPPWDGG